MTRNHSPAFWLMASELTVKFQYVMKYYTKLRALTGSLGCPAQQKLQHSVTWNVWSLWVIFMKSCCKRIRTFSQDVRWVKGGNEPGKDCFSCGKGIGNPQLVRGICNGFL